MEKIETFKAKEKFTEDHTILYPGIGDESLKPILAEKINKVADDFIAIAKGHNPTEEQYFEKIKSGLERFSEVYISLDTEDRERVCSYFEELMDIVGLKNSDGLLNEFIYGFDAN